MSDERFDILFCGEILPGKDRFAVKQALAATFRLDSDQAERLFSGTRFAVARGVSKAKAHNIRTAIEQAGGVCTVIPAVGTQEPPATVPPHDPSPPTSVLPASANSAAIPRDIKDSAGSPPRESSSTIGQPPHHTQSRSTPPRFNNAHAASAHPKRKDIHFSLMVGVPLLLVILVVATIKFLPHNPPRSELVKLVNQRLASMQELTTVIEENPNIRSVKVEHVAGQKETVLNVKLGSSVLEDTRALLGHVEQPIDVLAKSINEANLQNNAQSSIQQAKQSMKKFEEESKKYSKEYQAVVKDIVVFQKACDEFTTFALTPKENGLLSITKYAMRYHTLKHVIFSNSKAILSKLNSLKSSDSDTEKRYLKEEVERYEELVRAMR